MVRFIIYLSIFFCMTSCKTNEQICTNPDKTAMYGKDGNYGIYLIRSKIDSFDFYKFRYDLVINKTGKITEVKSYNENCRTDSLMIKHILKMPKWSPAIKDGKKVKSIYHLKFHIAPNF